jgi:hypothetical protein
LGCSSRIRIFFRSWIQGSKAPDLGSRIRNMHVKISFPLASHFILCSNQFHYPREVRRLEKEESWSCDSPDCSLSWNLESTTDLHLDRPRYRCVHYRSGGGCNIDLCGTCFLPNNEQVPQLELTFFSFCFWKNPLFLTYLGTGTDI